MDRDIDKIRSQFPALERVEAGWAAAFFDGPGGTQVPVRVVNAMQDYLLDHNANTHWKYATSRETDQIIASSRATLADFLNCDEDEVVFGANMTTLTFHVARSIGRSLAVEDEIIVTDLDHQANVAPWKALIRDFGITVKVVPMLPDGKLDLEALHAALTERTRLVAIGAASNALGTITDLKPIVSKCTRDGIHVFVDAVHYAPHRLIDFKELGAPFVACSPYKFYGPHLGVLACRKDVIEQLEVPRLDPAPDSAPERMETGTLSHEAIAGAAAAVEFLASVGKGAGRRSRLESAFDFLEDRCSALLNRLWSGLESIDAVTLFGPGPTEQRTPTVAFTVNGVPSSMVASRLSGSWGVFVSHGDFYASRVVETLGLQPEGLVRAGCACYTTEEEVDRLIEGVLRIATDK